MVYDKSNFIRQLADEISKIQWVKSEPVNHFLVSFIYLLVLSLLRSKLDVSLIWLWAGGLIGTYLPDIDHLIYWFWAHPEEEDSIKAKKITRGIRGVRGIKGIREIVIDLYRLGQESHYAHIHLIFHTITFQLILLVLTVYVLSSSGSYFGAGLVLAMNLHLLKDIWQDYFVRGKEVLAEWFLWQVRGWGVERYLREYLILTSAVFILISVLFA